MIPPLVGLFLVLSLTTACPSHCKCLLDSVDCTRLALVTFPNNIPATTKILRLSHNKLSILPPNSLAQLTALEELYVSSNKINFLYSDTFRANRLLKVLHLDHNKIQELPYDILSSQQLLQTLSVEHNQLASLPDDLFKNTPYITTLKVDSNPSLKVIPLEIVSLPSITEMTVDSVLCQCSTLSLTSLLTAQHRDSVKISCGSPQVLAGADVRSLHSSMFDGCGLSKTTCSQDEFQCADGECIDIGWRCDKMLDCTDGSDETNCQGGCGPEEFQCASGHCVEEGVRCDGNFDCMDKSDEEACITTVIPDIVECEYECDNKEKCLSSTWLCDGYTDCTDGSDEAGCSDAVSTVCGEGQFECYTNQRCINTTQMCNGANDCGDGSDESKFLCRAGERMDNKPPCPAGQVQCVTGECFWHNWLCDGLQQCLDHSDEMNCGLEVCNGTMVSCDNGRCIDSQWLCDGVNDCGDNSDELNCAAACSETEIRCGSGECVHCKWACDGYNDCKDGSDEAVCPVTCSGTECLESVSGKVFTVANIVLIITCSAVVLVSAFVIFIIIKCRYKHASPSPRPPRYNEIDFTSQQTINQTSIPSSPPPRYKSEPDLNSGIATRLIEEGGEDGVLCTSLEVRPVSADNDTSVVSLSSSSEESEL